MNHESKTLTKHLSCECNINLMVENVVQIKIGITINICVSAKIQKNIICAKRIIFGVLLHPVAKMVNFKQVLLMIQ